MNIFNLGVNKLEEIGNRFRNLFPRADFRCNDETCACWILMHFENPVHDR